MHKIRPATVFVLQYAYATMRYVPSKPRDIMYLLLGIFITQLQVLLLLWDTWEINGQLCQH